MSAPGDELERSYRRSYHRLMIGSVVICILLLTAIAAGQTAIVPMAMRHIVLGLDYISPQSTWKAPTMRAAPECRTRKSWSMVEAASLKFIARKDTMLGCDRRGYGPLSPVMPNDVLKSPLFEFSSRLLGWFEMPRDFPRVLVSPYRPGFPFLTAPAVD